MKVIELSKEGILPGTDVTLALAELFQKNPKDTTFVFEKGTYYFSPHPEMEYAYQLSNSDWIPLRKLGVWMQRMENCVIQGSGASLCFSGHMQALTLDHCKNIQIHDLEIDWEKPLVAEGIVTGSGEGYIDMYVDPKVFPHRLNDNWLEFDVGNGEWYSLNHFSQIQFDSVTGTVRRDTGDCFRPQKIEEVGDHRYRFTAEYTDTAVGNIFVLRHNARLHAGIFTEKCENITFSDIKVYSCGGLGCLAQFCQDMTYRRVHFIPHIEAGRRISNGRDDGMHITCCSGMTTITECTFMGLMDDPINVHGCCALVQELLDEKTVRCRYAHDQAFGFQYWAESGDEIVFIEQRHMEQIRSAAVHSYERRDRDTFDLIFEQPLPKEILRCIAEGKTLAVDNLTNTTAFTCTGNRFGSCRARGILVSTPKPVVIKNNYFASSGSAILVAGDANYWYESGECHDVEISENIFTDACLSSNYQFCEGIISICPEIPEPELDKPFHKNIRITHNTFDTDDRTVLYGFSCEGLLFAENRIYKSPCLGKQQRDRAAIRLKYCKVGSIRENSWIGTFGYEKMLDTENCEKIQEMI